MTHRTRHIANAHQIVCEESHTSYTEYEVDALAHRADEGRGDRRNVWGELHPSDEPQDSE